MLLLQVPLNGPTHLLERPPLHPLAVLDVEIPNVGITNGLHAFGDFVLNELFGRNAFGLGRVSHEGVRDNRVERRPAAVINGLVRLCLGRRILCLPPVIQLPQCYRAVPDAGGRLPATLLLAPARPPRRAAASWPPCCCAWDEHASEIRSPAARQAVRMRE